MKLEKMTVLPFATPPERCTYLVDHKSTCHVIAPRGVQWRDFVDSVRVGQGAPVRLCQRSLHSILIEQITVAFPLVVGFGTIS
jgi:hypothetical protein